MTLFMFTRILVGGTGTTSNAHWYYSFLRFYYIFLFALFLGAHTALQPWSTCINLYKFISIHISWCSLLFSPRPAVSPPSHARSVPFSSDVICVPLSLSLGLPLSFCVSLRLPTNETANRNLAHNYINILFIQMVKRAERKKRVKRENLYT